MHVKVKLYGDLKKHAPGQGHIFDITLGPEETLAHALKRLSISENKCVTLINGKRAKSASRFTDGDTLVVFPPISGG